MACDHASVHERTAKSEGHEDFTAHKQQLQSRRALAFKTVETTPEQAIEALACLMFSSLQLQFVCSAVRCNITAVYIGSSAQRSLSAKMHMLDLCT